MPVSERDKRHFQVIAEAKRVEREVRRSESAAESPMKRMIEGLEMADAVPLAPGAEARLDERALGQAELHRRARRLGLLR